jgi:hypothetical protein
MDAIRTLESNLSRIMKLTEAQLESAIIERLGRNPKGRAIQ